MRLFLFLAIFCLLQPALHGAVPVSLINFHNEATDTTRITELLIEAEKISDPNERIITLAKKFEGTPYVAGTLESSDGEEHLTVNLDELDCTTFVDVVTALAYTAGQHRTSWRDFTAALERLRYRGGEMQGYASRLHYFSDWVVDNTARGNIKEVTNRMPSYKDEIKTLNFMSRNRDKYPALADSATFEKFKSYEIGYRNHMYPVMKSRTLGSRDTRSALRDGDIVALVTKTQGLDVVHLGFIVKDDKGVPYLLNASSAKGKVIVDEMPLIDRLTRDRSLLGIRIVRLVE